MNSKINILVFILLAVCAYAGTRYFDSRGPNIIKQPTAPSEAVNGEIVPEFSFTDLKGDTHNIREFENKVIVLNFWASWCPPCVKEFPALLDFAETNKDNVVLIALSSDLDETAIKQFLKKQKKPGKNVYIAIDPDMKITQKTFQTFKLPETILIDAQQKMRQKIAGADWKPAYLQEQVQKMHK